MGTGGEMRGLTVTALTAITVRRGHVSSEVSGQIRGRECARDGLRRVPMKLSCVLTARVLAMDAQGLARSATPDGAEGPARLRHAALEPAHPRGRARMGGDRPRVGG